jgi:hypothetical protein
MNRATLTPALLAAIVGMIALPASAVDQFRNQVPNGAGMCTLSLPTIDTMVRPRAGGFRNEGTTSAFTICSFGSQPGGGNENFTGVILVLKSLDGADHEVTCTAVNSLPNGDVAGVGAGPQQFVSKTMTVNDSGPYTVFGTLFTWEPADFGETTEIPFSGIGFSVTCNLPPQVSVVAGIGNSVEDVGN